jgi:tetratricopeptide (TPR) repeat protein
LVILTGCPPTLSEANDTFLDAMAIAERHAHHGRLAEAEQAYARAAEEALRRVDLDEALYRRSRVLREMHRFDEAVGVLDVISARRPPSRRTARATFDAAYLRHLQLDQIDRAAEQYEEVLREYSDAGFGTRAVFFRLEIEAARGGDDAVLAFIDRLYPDVGTTSVGDDLLMARYRVLLERGDRPGARAALEKLVHEHPYPQGHRWDDAILRLADMEEEDGNFERAIERLEYLVRRTESTSLVGSYTLSSFPVAQLRIARIYRDKLHDTDAAIRAYRRFARLFRRSRYRDDALFELAILYLEGGQRSRGCSLLHDIVEDYEVGHARRLATAKLESDCGEPPATEPQASAE